VVIASAVWGLAPAARAQDHAQPAFLAGLVVALVAHEGQLLDADLIRLHPDAKDDMPLEDASSGDVVDLLGCGIDVSSQLTGATSDGSILLQLKPNLGSRGGLVRWTFRF